MANILICVIPYDNGKSGISNYINNVVEELSKNNKLDLIILEKDIKIFPVNNENVNFIKISNTLKSAFLNMIWVTFVLPFFIKYKKYDFIFLPAGNRRVFAFYKIKTIVTFHDLSQFNIKGKYDPFRMFYIKKIIPFFLKKAPVLNAISENTKKDMIKHYKMDNKKITVNYNGYEEDLFNEKLKPDKQKIKEEYNIEKKYILYIARIEHPGKNHINLVKAYAMLPQNIKDEYDLVFAGGMWNGGDKVVNYVNDNKIKNVKFTGFVSNEMLPVLFKTASLYAFPSLYEGFGIPLIQAMACGVPVVCSNTSSLPEIGRDAVLLFDPENPEEIKERIVTALNDRVLKEQLISKGLKRVKDFSWKKHAEVIIKLYETF